jgi:hypothetical protein
VAPCEPISRRLNLVRAVRCFQERLPRVATGPVAGVGRVLVDRGGPAAGVAFGDGDVVDAPNDVAGDPLVSEQVSEVTRVLRLPRVVDAAGELAFPAVHQPLGVAGLILRRRRGLSRHGRPPSCGRAPVMTSAMTSCSRWKSRVLLTREPRPRCADARGPQTVSWSPGSSRYPMA